MNFNNYLTAFSIEQDTLVNSKVENSPDKKPSQFTNQVGRSDETSQVGEIALNRVAKLEAENPNHKKIFQSINQLEIDETSEALQNELIKTAKLAAGKLDPTKTSESIDQFEVDEITLINIAQLVAENPDRKKIFQSINQLGIDETSEAGQNALIKIATIAAEVSKGRISRSIKEFGIDETSEAGQKGLIEIATITAKYDRTGLISETIREFGIDKTSETGQNALIKIATIAAKNDRTGSISGWIENYGIDKTTEAGQNALIKIATIAAKYDQTGLISRCICDYGIDETSEAGQKGLIQIATIAAKYDPTDTISSYIRNYGINAKSEAGQKGLVKIAKIVAKHRHNSQIAKLFKNYGIKNPDDALKIAKIIARHDKEGTISEYIGNFNVNATSEANKKTLVEIAKLTAKYDRKGKISQYIKNYGIKNSEDLFEIAKIAANNPSFLTFLYLKNYSIVGDDNQFEIAKILASTSRKKGGCNLLRLLQICSIKDEAQIEALFKLQLETDLENIKGIFYELESSKGREPYHQAIAKIAAKFEETQNEYKAPILSLEKYTEFKEFTTPLVANKSLSEQARNACASWILNIIHYSETYGDNFKEELLGPLSKLFATIRDCHESNDRVDFTRVFFQSYASQTDQEKKDFISESISLRTANHKRIGTLLVGGIFNQMSPGSLENVLSKINSEKSNQKKKSKSDLLKVLVNSICVDKDSSWINSTNRVLCMICDDKIISGDQKFQLLNMVAEVGKKATFKKRKEAITGILQTIDLLVYFGFTNRLFSDKGELVPLNPLLKQIFNEVFSVNNIDNIDEKYTQTFGKFKNPTGLFTYFKALNQLTGADKKKALDAYSLFIAGVLEGNFKSNRYNLKTNIHLEQIFSGREELLQKWMEGLCISENELTAINKVHDRSEGEVIKSLEQLHDPTRATELEKSAKEFINIKNNIVIKDEFKIEDTDDPEALLSSGNESTGSCQKLDGLPNFNKGLLGYLLNGQTRYFTVRDKSNKLMGRCLMRILWDEEKGQPALFKEKNYINQQSERVEKLLDAMCAKRAEDLGLPCYDLSHTPLLKSLGGPSPFEYVDACYGIQEGSIYSIPKT